MSEGLLRQRRNLILTSALLWLLKFGGVTLTKMSLAGIEVEFARPEALPLCLWIAFFYFLWRYYQYFVPEGVPKIQATFQNTLNRYAQSSLDKYARAKEPLWMQPNHQPTLLQVVSAKWVYKAYRGIRDPDGVVRSGEPFELAVPKLRFVHTAAFALLNLLARTSLGTDYLLPLLLAGGVLWYCGTPDWNGSFVTILFLRDGAV